MKTKRAIDPDTNLPFPQVRPLTTLQKLKLALAINRIFKGMKKTSWKTTLGGLIALVAPVIPQILPPQWHWVQGALVSIGGAIIGFSARDNDVSSEDAGAK